MPPRNTDVLSGNGSAQPTKSLIVEGWRFLAHSYAMVNQWQLLAISRRPDISLKVIDVPFHGQRWRTQEGLFELPSERILQELETAKPEESADVTLRMSFPYNFAASPSRQTAVFATSESQVLRPEHLPSMQAYEQLQRMPPGVNVVTPSLWSAQGFYRAGFKAEQVLIVPHGVDAGTFHPMPELRDQVREAMSIAKDDFVFLSVGAMTGNKGIDLLLKAFAVVCQRFPHVRLVLKGMDPLYNSKDLLLKSLQTVSASDRKRVLERTSYLGDSLSNKKLAEFFQIADVYVSPYRAEAFNIPVLEAAACGLPVICTRGGPTDEFVTDEFSRKIDSQKRSIRIGDQDASRLEPNLEHLTSLMSASVEDGLWRAQASQAGPAHVRENYNWDSVVDRLVEKFFPSGSAR